MPTSMIGIAEENLVSSGILFCCGENCKVNELKICKIKLINIKLKSLIIILSKTTTTHKSIL